MNKFEMVGNLVKDADLQYTKDEHQHLKIQIAVRNPYARDEEHQADFFFLDGFGDRWENVAKYLTKGIKVGVVGRIQNNNYEDQDGNLIYQDEYVIDELELLSSQQSSEPSKKPTRKTYRRRQSLVF